MKPINLVQRATIKVPLASDKSTLTQSVNFDYMGSAEFEFGALSDSLKRMEDKQKDLNLSIAANLGGNGINLRIFSYLTNKDINEYMGQLYLLRKNSNTIRTKERTDFAENEPPPIRADFWWDIENDVMWSFHKEYMNRLEQFLYNSWAIMK